MACKSILIVEDEPLIRETLQLTLELHGYSVTATGNGKEGLDALASGALPGLILLDLMMPVMNGWEFAKSVRHSEALSMIPIVVITAFPEKARDLAVQEIKAKPLSLQDIIQVAEKYCGRPEAI